MTIFKSIILFIKTFTDSTVVLL